MGVCEPQYWFVQDPTARWDIVRHVYAAAIICYFRVEKVAGPATCDAPYTIRWGDD